MAQLAIAADSNVFEVMERWPSTIPLFANHRMLCIGCIFGRFHTIADACKEHQVGLDEFLEVLNSAKAVRRR
ncbi:MAG TPA: DUF1858 domain-containing protein [Paracoccaceae bacterium]|nr:DUF1858 domain-containing protein [Paracoccaceae bacterium]